MKKDRAELTIQVVIADLDTIYNKKHIFGKDLKNGTMRELRCNL